MLTCYLGCFLYYFIDYRGHVLHFKMVLEMSLKRLKGTTTKHFILIHGRLYVAWLYTPANTMFTGGKLVRYQI